MGVHGADRKVAYAIDKKRSGENLYKHSKMWKRTFIMPSNNCLCDFNDAYVICYTRLRCILKISGKTEQKITIYYT